MTDAASAWVAVTAAVTALLAMFCLGWAVGRRRRRPEPVVSAGPLLELHRQLVAELHHGIAHEVSAVLLQAAGARALAGRADPRVASALSEISQACATTMHELVRQRDVLAGLGVEPLSPAPDLSGLSGLLARSREAGVAVRVTSSGAPGPLDPSVSRSAYLVIDTALALACRHPGASVLVDLAWEATQLRLRVRIADAGPTALVAERITDLADRFRLLGGEIDLRELDGRQVLTSSLPVATRHPCPTPNVSLLDLSAVPSAGHTGA